MHRDDPICRARAALRGLPHILRSVSRSWRASWGPDWQLPTPGVTQLQRCILGSLSLARCSDGGLRFLKGNGKWGCCPLPDLVGGVMEHTGAQWLFAGRQRPQPQHTQDEPGTYLSGGERPKFVLIDGGWYCFALNFYCMKILFSTLLGESIKHWKGKVFPFILPLERSWHMKLLNQPPDDLQTKGAWCLTVQTN